MAVMEGLIAAIAECGNDGGEDLDAQALRYHSIEEEDVRDDEGNRRCHEE